MTYMTAAKPRLAVTMGDPAGIGPEIILKAMKEEAVHDWADLVVVGDRSVIADQAAHLNIEVELVPHTAASAPGTLPILSVTALDRQEWSFGEVRASCGKASAEFLAVAANLAKTGEVSGIVTGPINKEALKAANYPFPGHTEALGEFFGVQVETMFVVDQLRIFFLSRHVSLKTAIEMVNATRVVEILQHADHTLKTFGIAEPKIAVAGLNPHGGESGLFGQEEMVELAPGVASARELGIAAFGPVPADSVFHQARQGRYDAVIALYHDQGHIAAKMHDFYRTVSVTTGLPVVRTSVDHGTAFDIAGQGVADPLSLVEAIRVAAEFATHREVGTGQASRPSIAH